MGLKFNPPKQIGRYAIFVDYGLGGKSAFFKVYNDLGSAKNAAWHKYGWTEIRILENIDGDWYTLHFWKKGEQAPWQKEVRAGGWRNTYTVRRGVPMSREEYAEWRVRVERERIADGSASLDLNPGRDFVSIDAYNSNPV
jgi:hypothetical protein